MEKKSGSQIYIYCVPNGKEEWLVDLYLLRVPNGNEGCLVDLYQCAPNGKEECLVDFIYCVSLMEKKSGSKILTIVCP